MFKRCKKTEDGSHCRKGRKGRVGILMLLLGSAIAVPWAMAGDGDSSCERGGELTEERVREKMGRKADRMMSWLGASEDQRADVDAILDASAPSVLSYREEARDLKEEMKFALSEETVDRAELEVLREAALDLADRASSEALERVLDIAEVMDEEQRERIQERFQR